MNGSDMTVKYMTAICVKMKEGFGGGEITGVMDYVNLLVIFMPLFVA